MGLSNFFHENRLKERDHYSFNYLLMTKSVFQFFTFSMGLISLDRVDSTLALPLFTLHPHLQCLSSNISRSVLTVRTL